MAYGSPRSTYRPQPVVAPLRRSSVQPMASASPVPGSATTDFQQRATGSFSTDYGATWSPAVAINNPTGDSSGIQLAGSLDGQRAVATFVDFQTPDKEIVRTVTLTDGVWAPPVDVSALASFRAAPSPAVTMSADGSRVVVVFAQFQNPAHQIQARVSTDSGATYAPAVPLATDVTVPRSTKVVSSAEWSAAHCLCGGSPSVAGTPSAPRSPPMVAGHGRRRRRCPRPHVTPAILTS